MDIPTRIQAILVDGETGTYVPVLPVSGTVVTTGTIELANPYVTITGTSVVEVVGQPVAVSVSNQPIVSVAGTLDVSLRDQPVVVSFGGTSDVVLRNQPVAVNGTVVTTISSGTWPVSICNQPVEVTGTLSTSGVSTIQFAEMQSDAFGRLRTSNGFTVFSSSMAFDAQNHLWDTKTATGGSFFLTGTIAAMEMYVNSTSGSKVVRQTFAPMAYLPGKSMLVMMTGVLNTAPKYNNVSRIGLFDDTADKLADSGGDGIFFEQNGTNPVNIVMRSTKTGSQVDSPVARGSWNVDNFDGTGPSGLTLDFTKAQIFVIDLEWLGVGTVRTGFGYAGKVYPAHVFNNQNTNPGAYMRRASLPLRYEIQNVGATSGTSTMRQICSTCQIENQAGWLGYGRSYSADNGDNSQTITRAVNSPLLAIRLKPGRLRAGFRPTLVSATSPTRGGHISIYANGTSSGGSWADVGGSSSLQVNQTLTSFTGGTKLTTKTCSVLTTEVALDTINETFGNYVFGSSIAGTPIECIVSFMAVAGNGNAFASINWIEIDS